MRVDIRQKVRFIDTNSEQHDEPIHSVEVAPGFITFFCKGTQKAFWNRGAKHNAKVYHAEGPHTHWIYEQFPNQTKAGWDQHCHILVDDPGWSDFEFYEPFMHADLSAEIRAYFYADKFSEQTDTLAAAAAG